MYSIVIPCYKSSETIETVVMSSISEMKKMSRDNLEFVLVNDCSPDGGKTRRKLFELAQKYSFVKVIDLAKNVGQHNAMMAGLRHAEGDVIISMDDDMQTRPSELVMLFMVAIQKKSIVYFGILVVGLIELL